MLTLATEAAFSEFNLQITRDGRIVSEGTVRRNAARKEHKARTEDLLADTIVQNALELEVRSYH